MERMDGMDKKADRKLEALRADTGRRFGELEQKVDRAREGTEELKSKMGSLEGMMMEMGRNTINIQKSVNDLVTEVGDLKGEVAKGAMKRLAGDGGEGPPVSKPR